MNPFDKRIAIGLILMLLVSLILIFPYYVAPEPSWMPFDEYAAQTFMEKFELLKYTNDIYLAKIDGQYFGFTPVSITSNDRTSLRTRTIFT
ncbi:hypothetical protein JHK87_045880 [Glycine soja]|nr:hypothetical protein JHK87_045880 [Glycine soja]